MGRLHARLSRADRWNLQDSIMKHLNSTEAQASAQTSGAQDAALSPWQRLKSKRISYLTLPLLVMATVVEFVILATGWKYQQVVCLPQGMGVTFFGIGPIGATILAVELLKLPLAIWTASRTGLQKTMMLWMGLPLICVLTFQLVKDMAVYEMGAAMAPASQLLEKAAAEDTKISQLNGELAAIEQKKADRQSKHAELTAKKAKAKAELEEALKRNDEARTDAISLTDYQKKELSEVETRQAALTKQFNADAEQLTKSIADLRARRETELPGATKWNAEEARIENAYKTKLAEYTNKKTAYEKEKADYAKASFVMRQLMGQPVDPGVAPERESNTILKPTLFLELDAQIKAKEAELLAVNNKRRDTIAQVGEDARRIRGDFDRRSLTKRDESDRKREELLAAQAAFANEWKAEEKQIDAELALAVQKVDGLRAQVDAASKVANGFYEAREAAIRETQVHRIATTVEIVRGVLFGERPLSIKASSKERGDLLTDQISMVRIWVYPFLAFIVAFLPTLMVEVGFSTLFHRDEQQTKRRRSLPVRGLHQLYIRAGRIKMLRAERMAKEVSAQLAARDRAMAAAKSEAEHKLAEANASAEKALAEKELELQAAREVAGALVAEHEEKLKQKEDEWIGKFGNMADSLSKVVAEKDALQDFQKSEIERQVQLRQNSWSDRLSQMSKDLDSQRATHEKERTAMMQEHQQKLQALSEDCQTQVIQARRQATEAELAAQESTAKLAYDLKEALDDRDAAHAQMQQQTESLSLKLTQVREEASRDLERSLRQEKNRSERQQLEFDKALRQLGEDFEHRTKQREQEMTLEFETRIAKEQAGFEHDTRRREEEFERQLEARAREVEARCEQQMQQQDEAAQIRLKQREQQLQAQAAQELRRRESELERQLDVLSRETDTRLKQELQQQELEFQAKFKQREQELTNKAVAREIELQSRWDTELRAREEEWARQTEARVQAAETLLSQELSQVEQEFQTKLKQREQELISKAAARESELQNRWDAELRGREEEWARQTEARVRANESVLNQGLQQKELEFQTKLKQREQELTGKAAARESELQNRWDTELRGREEEWARQTEARVRAAEVRLGQESQQKEEILQAKFRQREQQLLAEFETRQAETQSQADHARRRRELESAEAGQRALRDLEDQLRQEMSQKEASLLAKSKQREQELLVQLSSQTESHKQTKLQWETEFTTLRRNIEPLNERLARAEQERDEARQTATEHFIRVQDMEKKFTEASSLLTGWKNGKSSVAGRVERDVLQVAHIGSGATGEH